MFKSLNKFKQKDIANNPKTEALSETQAINFCKEIQDNCNQCGFPITSIKIPRIEVLYPDNPW